MITLLFSPLGRYIAIGGVLLVVLGGVYVKIKSDAVNEYQAKATSEALKRTQDAIAAGDAAAISPERLLESDGHRRD
ncbi:hypothetical protein K0U83_10400 [bacterium]|nr:hypothetical protein [bacterium]